MARPDCCTERLPEVTPSFGLPAVEARTICTRPISTSSSSAAIWASAVTMPCPISTLPAEITTCLSGEKRTHDDSNGLAPRLTGRLGAEGEGADIVIGRPTQLPRSGPPAPCGYATRNGRGCGPERP